MNSPLSLLRGIAWRALGLSVLLRLGPAFAQNIPSEPPAAPVQIITVRVGETVTFMLPRRPMIINSENTDVATLVIRPDGAALVTGVSVGATRIIGRDIATLPMIFPVEVLAATHKTLSSPR
jgi:hypothetical protein